MSILESNRIDIVASRPDSNVVMLMITDTLGWSDLETHARLRRDKINSYLAFLESGQLQRLKEPRIPEKPEIRISLATAQRPTPKAEEFLAEVRSFLLGLGIDFEWRVSPTPY
jgi:hypothetical protein